VQKFVQQEDFMKKALGLIGVSLLFAGPALAADLAVKAPVYKARPLVAPTWAGWYIGGNAGWVGSANDTLTNTGTDTDGGGLGSVLAAGAIPASVNSKLSGFIGGGQIGYNWQIGTWVLGLEGDFDGIGAKTSTTAAFPGGNGFVPLSTAFNREADWLSTVRGRLGFTVTPAFLLYGTGGLAVGQTKVGSAFICPVCAPPSATEASTANVISNTSAGWTVGAGAEWMFAPQWSVKAEYLYVDLGTNSSTITYAYGANTSTLTSSVRDTYNVVRGGINFHF
jgi:outer membrane immunogenic protein